MHFYWPCCTCTRHWFLAIYQTFYVPSKAFFHKINTLFVLEDTTYLQLFSIKLNRLAHVSFICPDIWNSCWNAIKNTYLCVMIPKTLSYICLRCSKDRNTIIVQWETYGDCFVIRIYTERCHTLLYNVWHLKFIYIKKEDNTLQCK
jgi:hypothetical protein